MEYIKQRQPKIMYFIQHFSDVTLSWKEIRKTYFSEKELLEEAEKAKKKYTKIRMVKYTDGKREYKNI